ncbi:MAG: ABC transporter substrate-binding protein [Candidatus Thorarchaeota archaeon]
MLSARAKKVLAVSLVAAFTLMALSPALAKAQTMDLGTLKTGPFVEKLVYNVIEGDDQQVLALQNNEIDLIGDMVDPTHLATLSAAENIEVANVMRNGYGYVTINTAKYPFNITAYRRALAFALDKEKISDDVWDGLSEPQDSVVPKVNPFSVESLLTYHYYEANVDKGKQLLAAAGFVDSDSDGYLEGPGPGGPGTVELDKVTVECAQSSNIAVEVGTIVAEALTKLGLNAEAKPTDFYEYLNRLYFHQDYDIVFLGSSFNNFDVDWLAYEYWSEYADEPYWNFPNFRNSNYDAWRDQLLHSTDYDDVYEAAIEMQKVWVYQSPMIICYENILLSAYRTDKFEGFVNDVSGGVPGWWTNQKVHLKASEGGPFGGTFRWSNPLDIDTFNFMVSSSAYTMNVLGELYDSLLAQDWTGKDVNWLAESYTAETHADNAAIPEGHTRFTFNLIQNATWSDGTPLTADDVAYSLNYYKLAPGNPYGTDLTDLTAAYAPTPYTLVVEFNTESYWHLHTVGYKTVIPKHIFEDIGYDNWNKWNPNPPSDAMVTSGPFNISEYVAGEFTELTYNPNYFYGPDRTATTTPTTTPTTAAPDYTLAILAGAVGAAVVVLVGGYVLLRQR